MTAEEYHDYEEDDGERIVTTLTIEVSHPVRWSVDDIANELFQWGEANEPDSVLSVHAVREQADERYPDHPEINFKDMEDLEELEQCRALSDLEDLRYEENKENRV
jgi:hypothetical protein